MNKVTYNIEPKPGTYKGIPMRSQLEIAYARAMDNVGLSWRYEPGRVGGWLPDFAVDFTHKDECFISLVEVKPFSRLKQWHEHPGEPYAKLMDLYPDCTGTLPDALLKNLDLSWLCEPPSYAQMGFLGIAPEACRVVNGCCSCDFWGASYIPSPLGGYWQSRWEREEEKESRREQRRETTLFLRNLRKRT